MEIGCPHISQSIKLAVTSGNKIYKISDRNNDDSKLIIDMSNPLSLELKNAIDKNSNGLRYWQFNGVPHNPPENGYTCDLCNVVLIFPHNKTPSL